MIIKQSDYKVSAGVRLSQVDEVERSGYIPLERQIDMQRLAGQRLKLMHRALAEGSIPFDDTEDRIEDVVEHADDPLDIAMVACNAGEEIERYNNEYERIVESGQNPFVPDNQGNPGGEAVVSPPAETAVTV